MRIPGWLFIIGVLALAAGTLLCSAAAFGWTRQLVIDMGDQGVVSSSPLELVSLVLNGPDSLSSGQNPVFDENVPLPTPSAVQFVTQPTFENTAPAVETAVAAPPTTTPDPLLDNPILKDPRRKNILLLGIDQRDAVDEPGPFRTDTMILLTIDPVRKTAGVISIPRDLWANIPGFQPNRINTANSQGDANAYPGGGPALAAETVSANLGIPVQKYILINFRVFTTLVDLLAPEGIEINVREAIDDPKYPDNGYGTISVRFEPGVQRLNAERLLQYARTRATFGGDFDRARRQQEVIDALRAYFLNAGGVATFIGQAGTIWNELKDSYRTNLSLEEIIGLALLMGEIPRENIQFVVIDNHYVNLGTSSTGEQILLLKQGAVGDLIQRVYDPQTDLTLADLRIRAEAENASIVVYNNTDIAGLATQTSEWLASQQVKVTQVGNMPTPNNTSTVVRYYTPKEWTARYLAALLKLPLERIEPGSDGLTTADVMVVVGADIQTLLRE